MTLQEYLATMTSERKRDFFRKAQALGYDVSIVSAASRVTRIAQGGKSIFMVNDAPSLNRSATNTITRNKHLTKIILNDVGIAVPRGIEAATADDVFRALRENILHYPLVIKPIDAAKGIGITVNVTRPEDITRAVANIRAIKDSVALMVRDTFIAEEMFSGNDFRVLVLNDTVIACANRVPAHVIGDGTHSVAQLIARLNTRRPENYALRIDDDVHTNLNEAGRTVDTVPEDGEKVFLRKNANISSGGMAVDCTRSISNRFRDIALRAARAVNGTFVGIDLFTEDVTSEDPNQPYVVIEINGAPDYDIHEAPIIPASTLNVTEHILRYLFGA